MIRVGEKESDFCYYLRFTRNHNNFEKSLKAIRRNLQDLSHLYVKKIIDEKGKDVSQLGLIRIIRETGGEIKYRLKNRKKFLHIHFPSQQAATK